VRFRIDGVVHNVEDVQQLSKHKKHNIEVVVDRVRIGRRVLSGPVIDEGIDARSQAQDCFPSEIDPCVTPAGEHHRPTLDRFGTCALTMGGKLGRHDPCLLPRFIPMAEAMIALTLADHCLRQRAAQDHSAQKGK